MLAEYVAGAAKLKLQHIPYKGRIGDPARSRPA